MENVTFDDYDWNKWWNVKTKLYLLRTYLVSFLLSNLLLL
jgi:hypothetical protein